MNALNSYQIKSMPEATVLQRPAFSHWRVSENCGKRIPSSLNDQSGGRALAISPALKGALFPSF